MVANVRLFHMALNDKLDNPKRTSDSEIHNEMILRCQSNNPIPIVKQKRNGDHGNNLCVTKNTSKTRKQLPHQCHRICISNTMKNFHQHDLESNDSQEDMEKIFHDQDYHENHQL